VNDPLAAARQAQERFWSLRASGADPNSREGRRAVNQLMGRIRALSDEELAAFEELRARPGQADLLEKHARMTDDE
jgi:hypothetical protein